MNEMEEFISKHQETLAKKLFYKSHFHYMLNLEWEGRSEHVINHFNNEAYFILQDVYEVIQKVNEQ